VGRRRPRVPRSILILRILVAVAGGYLLAVLWALAFVGWWPGARADAVLLGTLSGFAICAGASIWAFSPLPWRRMAIGFAAAVVVLGALVLTGR
jgi:hypothetical protein